VRTENSTGQLALVAGASSGIGLELARLFVSHGYDLVVVAEDDGINSITVTALQSGPTDTNFFNRANMLDTKVGADKKDDPADVARDGFEALMAGKDQVVAGAFKNKVRSTMAQVTPDKVTAEMHRKLSEPGSASKVKGSDREVNP
jgi:short-subunit dehydrogenase